MRVRWFLNPELQEHIWVNAGVRVHAETITEIPDSMLSPELRQALGMASQVDLRPTEPLAFDPRGDQQMIIKALIEHLEEKNRKKIARELVRHELSTQIEQARMALERAQVYRESLERAEVLSWDDVEQALEAETLAATRLRDLVSQLANLR